MLDSINIFGRSGGVMKRALEMLVVGALILASTAIWALGSHIAWSAQKIMMAATVLAMLSLAIYL
jgi:hypothetical protein